MKDSLDRPETAGSSPDVGDQRSIDLNRLLLSGMCLSSLVHELNNPLHVIAATAELMLADPSLPPALSAKVERMFSHANRASTTVLEFVSFFRPSAESSRKLDLVALVEQVLAMRQVALKRSQVTLLFEPPAARALVVGRPSEIAQVVMNLLVNAEAAVAGPEGGTIHVSVETTRDCCRCSVVDSRAASDRRLGARQGGGVTPTRATDIDVQAGLRVASLLATRNGGTLLLDQPSTGARCVLELPLDQRV